MRFVILGGPGAGKGTQAGLLCKKLQIPLISTGEILRKGIRSQSTIGQQAQSYVEKGELVPDLIMIEFIRERLLQGDVGKGWLLEGYPRTAFQAEELDFLLDELKQQLDWAIWLKVSESSLIERSLNRGRMDDRIDIIQRRIDLFYERTIPIVEYYEYRQRLLTINGDLSPEEVEQEILIATNLLKSSS